MTLVIAGHDITKKNSRAGYAGESRGLFVVADSTITTGTQTLLSGFKKIYNIPLAIYKPSFVGVYFHNYRSVFHQTSCFIAFAGSTLTAQHVLNAIGNHLSDLRIGHEFDNGGYQILMACQSNSLTRRAGVDEWDEDMFLDSDMTDLLSGEVLCNIVLHSIRGALAGAKRHKVDGEGFKALLTQYVLGTYCEVHKRHRLYTFTPTFTRDVLGVIEGIDVDVQEIEQGKLAVLGMTRFADAANREYLRAFNAGEDVKTAVFKSLNRAIDEVQANGDCEIDRPSLLRAFYRGTLTELAREG